ncbi:MAG: recombination protein RecR [Bacteroidales bacterium]|nr:recombination protein RecR [Bacteroidales bacterium]
MHNEEIPSVLLSNAVSEFNKLPGIGSRTALRLALHMLKRPLPEVIDFSEAIQKMREEIVFCQQCHNISDSYVCSICSDHHRFQNIICVVESVKDVMAIEKTKQFKGVYHVLGGIISPIDGIGPSDLYIESLVKRTQDVKNIEIVFALPATMEGDTTCYYIHKKISNSDIKYSTLSRGIALGNDIEYADELTLGRSILNRTPFEPIHQ